MRPACDFLPIRLRYASSVATLFYETSAITNKGGTPAFSLLAKRLVNYEQEHNSNVKYKFKTDYVNLHGSYTSDADNLSSSH